jgi:hypothetical protein
MDTRTDDLRLRAWFTDALFLCSREDCRRTPEPLTDLQQHVKTLNVPQVSRRGYRCDFEGCPKVSKILNRLDGFGEHVHGRRNGDISALIRRMTRSAARYIKPYFLTQRVPRRPAAVRKMDVYIFLFEMNTCYSIAGSSRPHGKYQMECYTVALYLFSFVCDYVTLRWRVEGERGSRYVHILLIGLNRTLSHELA